MKFLLLILVLVSSTYTFTNIRHKSTVGDPKCHKNFPISKISKNYPVNEVLYVTTYPTNDHNGHAKLYVKSTVAGTDYFFFFDLYGSIGLRAKCWGSTPPSTTGAYHLSYSLDLGQNQHLTVRDINKLAKHIWVVEFGSRYKSFRKYPEKQKKPIQNCFMFADDLYNRIRETAGLLNTPPANGYFSWQFYYSEFADTESSSESSSESFGSSSNSSS